MSIEITIPIMSFLKTLSPAQLLFIFFSTLGFCFMCVDQIIYKVINGRFGLSDFSLLWMCSYFAAMVFLAWNSLDILISSAPPIPQIEWPITVRLS